MNAYSRTAHDLANAVLGKKRQHVHVCQSVFNGSPLGPRHVVSVGGVQYEVSDRILTMLREGWTPEELELEPFVDDEDEPEDGGESPSSLLRWYQSRVL